MGQIHDVVYLDFKKAFDRVPHNRLIFKLKCYGLGGELVDWIRYFLANRKRRVWIQGSCLEWINVTSGIPQGSVLDPILFIIVLMTFLMWCQAHYLCLRMTRQHIASFNDHLIIQRDIDNLITWNREEQSSLIMRNIMLCH